ncbi:hypothetical protein ACN47E_004372 [Coniothyrium glycines]
MSPLSPDTSATPPPIVPSPAQAALAIAIIRSKPVNCSVREYVSKLRGHVRRGQNPAFGLDADRYLDLAAYWREQYKTTEAECDRLRGINIKLERSNHLLTNLSTPAIASDVIPQSPKRKAATTSPARAQKKSKPTQSATTQDIIEQDSEFLDTLGPEGRKLTEALFTTHGLCRASITETEKLCYSLIQTSSLLGKVIFTVAQHHGELSHKGSRNTAASLDRDKSDFSTALSICARAFMSVLIGLNKLTHAGPDDKLNSLVICELVGMFNHGLQAIEVATRQSAQAIVKLPAESSKGKSKNSKSAIKESAPARSVAHLLIGFLGLLDKTDADHQRLFDGFTFMLLDRAAKQLYYCTFGQHRSTCVEDNIMPPANAVSPEEIAKQDADALGMRLEVKALVLILERAMGLAPNHMNPQNVRSTKGSDHPIRTLSMKNLPVVSRARLSPLAKDRLQRTLVACMYGSNTDDEFLDILTKPVPTMRLGSLPNVGKVDDADVHEWYKQEVWRLVGWDILAKEDGW